MASANAGNRALVKAVLCAALYPNIIQVELPPPKKGRGGDRGGEPKMVTRSGNVALHPCSVNFENVELGRFGLNRLMTFHEKVKTTKV